MVAESLMLQATHFSTSMTDEAMMSVFSSFTEHGPII